MSRRADGLLLVDKPAGVTSFAVVDRVRKALLRAEPGLQPGRGGRRGGPRPPRFKCGHTGTLDPMATGLLVILAGKGSRLVPFLTGLDKTYAATIRFGAETHSHDAEGEVVREAALPADEAAVIAALDAFRGDIMQVPPLVSALKRDGKPLHARVRAGEDLAEPEPRPVTISRLEVTAVRLGAAGAIAELDLEMDCSSGTYVRSLARDIGRAVGSAAHLSALRRLAVGPFTLEGAEADPMALDGQAVLAALRPLADALPDAALVPVDADEAAALALGGQPDAAWLQRAEPTPADGALVRLVDPEGRLAAVARRAGDALVTAAVLAVPVQGEPTPCD